MTAVLGGGLSGLSAAFYALENPKLGSVVVLEASNRLGGWISTKRSPSGAIFEQGPRTVRPQGPAGQNTLQLVDEMQLSNKIHPIPITHPAAIRRLIYMDKQLHPIPFNLKSIFIPTPPFKRSLCRVVWDDVSTPSIQKDDESLYSFIERRLGADIADYIISPVICGICAGDAKQISVHFLMSSVFEAEQKHGSIFKGILKEKLINNALKKSQLNKTNLSENEHMSSAELSQKSKWAVWGLEGGLEQLPQALADNLISKNVHIHLGTECKELIFKSDYVEVRAGGDTKKYERVVSSLPAKVLAPLVANQHPQLAGELEAIPSVTVALVNLEFSGKVLSEEAFGFLVPPCEELPILGVIFDSCIFPQESTVLTVMMGGAWYDKYFGPNSTEEQILSIAVNQVKTILNIEESPIAHNVAILKDCIPQYIVGHKQRVNRINNYILEHKLPIALCGSSYTGVGVNDVIMSAKKAVSNIASI